MFKFLPLNNLFLFYNNAYVKKYPIIDVRLNGVKYVNTPLKIAYLPLLYPHTPHTSFHTPLMYRCARHWIQQKTYKIALQQLKYLIISTTKVSLKALLVTNFVKIWSNIKLIGSKRYFLMQQRKKVIN